MASTKRWASRTYVVIKELRVLLGVEHLEKSTRGVAVVSPTDLVDLVDEHERVLCVDLLERLNDLTCESKGR